MLRTVLNNRFWALLVGVLVLVPLTLACATNPAPQVTQPMAPSTAETPAEASAAPAPAPAAESTAMAGVAPLPYLDELPPLIDRSLFFGDPEIARGQLSPNGEYLTFLRPYKDVRNIWIKRLEEPFESARPLTADDRPVSAYFWSEDGKYVLYVQDKGGNENFHIYAVDPTQPPEESTGVPPARDLTPLEGVRAYIYAVPEATSNQILIGLNDRDPALHDVYRLNIETGERTLLIENDQRVAAWIADHEGNVRLAWRQTADGGSEILKVEDGELGEAIYTCSFKESCFPFAFHKDGERVFVSTNKGEDVNLSRLVLMDADTGAIEPVESDPKGEVDFGGVVFSDATEELLATVYVGDRVRIYPRDPRFAEALEFLKAELPDGDFSFGGFTNDDHYLLVSVSSDLKPGSTYLFDWEEMTVEKLYDVRPDLAEKQLAPMKPIRYTARDGLEIPGYLTLPPGAPAHDLALVVNPHGGPWYRNTWGFDPYAQFLANRGYAVFQPNFRGSTGYGEAFLNAGNEEWGTGAMQHDITDGVKYLIDQGIADPEKICIFGGSYGGYATLDGVTFTPDLYACGISYVGPSNLITLLNSIPAYWGPIKKIFSLRVGDPDDPEDQARLKAQSPFFHAEQITAPLLVVQGANDPRVKKAESDQIVVKLRELGRDVSYLVAPDEGHGFRGLENRMAFVVAAERFFAEYLGGRVQESVQPDVAARLAELTVDVGTVEMPKLADSLDAAKTSPLPAVDSSRLAFGTAAYETSFTVQGREMTMSAQRALERAEVDGQSVVRITDTVEGPMGTGEDRYLLEADSLTPISRHVTQGPATIEVNYGDREVTGSISARGQTFPVSVTLEAPVWGAGGALETAITALPLDEDYRTTVRAVEVGMQQRVRYFELAVTGAETVEVPAGSFETFRVELTPLDGEPGAKTFWVTRDTPRFVVQGEAELPPQMGGGTATTVLVEAPAQHQE